MNDTVHRLLIHARSLLATPQQWAQGMGAVHENGQRVDALSPWARSYDCFGALLAAYVEVTGHPAKRAKHLLTRHQFSAVTPLGRAIRILAPLATGLQFSQIIEAANLAEAPMPVDEADGLSGGLWMGLLRGWELEHDRQHAELLAAFDAAIEAASLEAAYAA